MNARRRSTRGSRTVRSEWKSGSLAVAMFAPANRSRGQPQRERWSASGATESVLVRDAGEQIQPWVAKRLKQTPYSDRRMNSTEEGGGCGAPVGQASMQLSGHPSSALQKLIESERSDCAKWSRDEGRRGESVDALIRKRMIHPPVPPCDRYDSGNDEPEGCGSSDHLASSDFSQDL